MHLRSTHLATGLEKPPPNDIDRQSSETIDSHLLLFTLAPTFCSLSLSLSLFSFFLSLLSTDSRTCFFFLGTSCCHCLILTLASSRTYCFGDLDVDWANSEIFLSSSFSTLSSPWQLFVSPVATMILKMRRYAKRAFGFDNHTEENEKKKHTTQGLFRKPGLQRTVQNFKVVSQLNWTFVSVGQCVTCAMHMYSSVFFLVLKYGFPCECFSLLYFCFCSFHVFFLERHLFHPFLSVMFWPYGPFCSLLRQLISCSVFIFFIGQDMFSLWWVPIWLIRPLKPCHWQCSSLVSDCSQGLSHKLNFARSTRDVHIRQ